MSSKFRTLYTVLQNDDRESERV